MNYCALRYEMQRFRNECNFLLAQVESMRRQNSKDNFPKIIKEYLIQADKKLCDVEIVMAQVRGPNSKLLDKNPNYFVQK